MKHLLIFCLAALFVLPVKADLTRDMNTFFNDSGLQANVTGAGAYKGQMAGLYTGGQIYARSPVKTIYPANINLPSYSAGCGGIDIHMGSFSFLTGDDLKNSMMSIAQNAGSYAFMLAMDTVSPQINGIQKHLSNLTNMVNRANINSCEMASSLVGGLWPRDDMARNHICSAAGVKGNFMSDWSAARQGCGGDKSESILNSEKTKKDFDDYRLYQSNLAWKLLSKKNYQYLSETDKELLMTMGGTIIHRTQKDEKDETHDGLQYLNAKASDINFIKGLLYGGEVSLLDCDETTSCLKPKTIKYKIEPDKSFVKMVETQLNDIRKAVINGTDLKDEQINFLGSTPLPLYKMFNVEYAYARNKDVLNINSYAESIALDILYLYLEENLKFMLSAAQNVDMGEDHMKEYKKDIHQALNNVKNLRKDAALITSQTTNAIQQVQFFERVLAGELSSHLMSMTHLGNGG